MKHAAKAIRGTSHAWHRPDEGPAACSTVSTQAPGDLDPALLPSIGKAGVASDLRAGSAAEAARRSWWNTRGMDGRRVECDLGVARSWGAGPEVLFLSNPLADPVGWSAPVRSDLVAAGYRVTTFDPRPQDHDWQSVVGCVDAFIRRGADSVALVGWSQGAAVAQEVALRAEAHVGCAALLATYGRQNELDKVLQEAWQRLVHGGDDLDCLRLALGLLTAFPPEQLADDDFVQHLRAIQPEWAGRPDPEARERAATFISTYQDRLPSLEQLSVPCLVMGFELDTDTTAARAREVARAVSTARYVEVPGLGHAAPISDPELVWPPVVDFLKEHHPAS